jgi:hypothetical protein
VHTQVYTRHVPDTTPTLVATLSKGFVLTFQKFHQKNRGGNFFEITTFNSMVLQVAKKVAGFLKTFSFIFVL